MKIVLKFSLRLIFSAIVILIGFLLLGCPSSSVPEQIAEAQTNQSNIPVKELVHKDLEFLQDIKDPCDYRYLKNLETDPGVRKLYNLINAGFPKETSIEEAVATFNRLAECDDRSKMQPPLTVAEVVAALRDWDCTEEKDADDKKFCADVWKIADTGKMPQGSFFDFDRGMGGTSRVRGYKGYYVHTWEIFLYLHLDKFRRDLRDVPEFSRSIRLKYISSEKE